MKLLDTDTCVAILRENTIVLRNLASEIDSIATTWITGAELYYGAAKSVEPLKNSALVSGFLASLRVLNLDDPAVQIFGETKARLERQGQRLADADLFIAATALAHGATVVTGNTRRYGRIPGLTLANWLHNQEARSQPLGQSQTDRGRRIPGVNARAQTAGDRVDHDRERPGEVGYAGSVVFDNDLMPHRA